MIYDGVPRSVVSSPLPDLIKGPIVVGTSVKMGIEILSGAKKK